MIAAHPDDETIGAGALLARSIDAHVAIVCDIAPADRSLWASGLHVTTREEYTRIRSDELRGALGETGIGPDRIHLLGITDGIAVDAISIMVPALVRLFAEIQPDIVLTHAYEGGHVDHDATALAVHAAMAMSQLGHPHEMALYHGAGDRIAVHEFLPEGPPASTLALDERLRRVKSQMLRHYKSQEQYRVYFGTDVERYRCAPVYDFQRSPSESSTPLYDRNDPTTGERWRSQARAGIKELGLLSWLDGRTPAMAAVGVTASTNERPSGFAAPLVSVIVRTVGRDTLQQALDSIASQTHPNIEIILVDVSPDGVAQSWSDCDGVVMRRCLAPGFDRPKAANAGLAAASGAYVAFLDDDDWFHPHHIAALLQAMQTSAGARVAYSGIEAIEWPEQSAPKRRWIYDSPYDAVALLCENYIPLNALLLDKSLVEQGASFDEALPLFEDWDFLIALSRRTSFAKADGIGAVYRWPPGSGVNDPQRTVSVQERIFAKWQQLLSADEHVAIMRRAIEQSELKDGRNAQLLSLQAHLKIQDEELERLRPQVSIQENQLEELRRHLKAQDTELAQLRRSWFASQRHN